ncbi:MAG: hypothetical protein RIB30_09910 [Thalassospira sp.]|jgi:hypothetical protein|uniref:hypothetical protein n=1 Tax=Thalassospira sp. TaxID=1912094 RepID=UPI0030EEB6B2|tara:strand:- start:51807 stop:51986 length:180 start_codon:yes stop_codon:yes gene_type:complete
MVINHNDLTRRIETLLLDLRQAETSNAVYREPALYLHTAQKALGSIADQDTKDKNRFAS